MSIFETIMADVEKLGGAIVHSLDNTEAAPVPATPPVPDAVPEQAPVALTPIEPLQVPANSENVPLEVAKLATEVVGVVHGGAPVDPVINDAASMAAEQISAHSDPSKLHERLTNIEGVLAQWGPVLATLAKEFGL